jgi:filamentous hemagglutinin
VNQDPIGLEGGKNFYSYSSNTTKWIDILGFCVKEAEKKLNETMAPHKGKRNAPSIMVAAYTATGLIEVASNGDIPGKIAPELQELADRHGGVGAKTECGNTIGRCAEFRAANKLLLDNPDLKLKDIKFTKAKRPRTGQARPYCDNCVNIFGVTN